MSRHLLTHVPRQPLRYCGAPPDCRDPRTNRLGGGAHHITTLRPVTAPAYARAAPGLRSPLLRRCRKRSGLSASASLLLGYAHRVPSVRSFHRRDVPPRVRNTSAVPLPSQPSLHALPQYLCGTRPSSVRSGSPFVPLSAPARPLQGRSITALRLVATRLSRHLLTHVPRHPLRSDLRSFHEHHILLRLQAGRHRLRPYRPAFRRQSPSVRLRADCDGLYATDAARPTPSMNSTWTRRTATATQDFVAGRPGVAP